MRITLPSEDFRFFSKDESWSTITINTNLRIQGEDSMQRDITNDVGFRFRSYESLSKHMSGSFDIREKPASPVHGQPMRSTCLHDTNDTEIFELDVVVGKTSSPGGRKVDIFFLVEWRGGKVVLVDENGGLREDLKDIADRLTVKGNIIQSPLLGAKFDGNEAVKRIELKSEGKESGKDEQKAKEKPVQASSEKSVAAKAWKQKHPQIAEAIQKDGAIREIDGRWSEGYVNMDELLSLVNSGDLKVEERGGIKFVIA